MQSYYNSSWLLLPPCAAAHKLKHAAFAKVCPKVIKNYQVIVYSNPYDNTLPNIYDML